MVLFYGNPRKLIQAFQRYYKNRECFILKENAQKKMLSQKDKVTIQPFTTIKEGITAMKEIQGLRKI